MTPPDPLASSAGTPDEIVTEAPAEVAITTPDAEQTVESSATEKPGEKPASLLNLVKSVVADKPADAESPPVKAAESAPDPASTDATQANPPASDDPDATAEAKGEKGDEELPFHKHPRFQELVREKNANASDAKEFRAIGAYMTEQNLSADEVDTGFVIMAAIKNDPRKALEMLAPTIKALRIAAGEDLSPEVAKLVEDGEMTEAAAQELSRTRADLALQTERNKQAAEQSSRQSAAHSQQQIVDAVTTWEAKIAASDPDYAAKKAIVFEKIQLAHLKNPARNPSEALAIAETALKDATALVRGFSPKRPEVKLPTASQSATHAKTAPKSLHDVVLSAVTG